MWAAPISLLVALLLCLQASAVTVLFQNGSELSVATQVIRIGPSHSIEILHNLNLDGARFGPIREAQCANVIPPFTSVTFLGLEELSPGSVVTAYEGGQSILAQLQRFWQQAKAPYIPLSVLGCGGTPHSRVVPPGMRTVTFTGHNFTGALYIDSRKAFIRDRLWGGAYAPAVLYIIFRFGFPIGNALRRLIRNHRQQFIMLRACFNMLNPRSFSENASLKEINGVVRRDNDGTDAPPTEEGEDPGQCPAMLDQSDLQPDHVHLFPQQLFWGNIAFTRENSTTTNQSLDLSYASDDGQWTISSLMVPGLMEYVSNTSGPGVK